MGRGIISDNSCKIFWLLPAFLPFCLAFGGVIVPKTYLILSLLCSEHSTKSTLPTDSPYLSAANSDEQCRNPLVQAEVARFQMYLNLITGTFAAITTPQFGALSDRVGRKKVILLASIGGVVMETITILVAKYPEKISINWLLLGALTDGLCGSFNAGMALAFAYASDCTPPEKRNVAFGYFHGVLFMGVAFGPILAGYIIQQTGDHVVCFYMAIGCHMFFMLFILYCVPESLSEERQRKAHDTWLLQTQKPREGSWMDRVTYQYVIEPLSIFLHQVPVSCINQCNLLSLAAIDTIMFGVAMSTIQIVLIYAEFKFGWNEMDSATFLSTTNIVRVACLVIVLPLLQVLLSRFSRSQEQHLSLKGPNVFEIGIIRTTLIINLLGYIGYAFAPTSHVLYIAGIVVALGGMGPPSLQSAMTKSVPSNMTGRLLGAMGCLHAAARVVTPSLLSLLYSLTVSTFAGTVFLCLAGLFVLTSAISLSLQPGGEVSLREL